MFNRIAVVLRGHVRTWHYINKLVFREFSNISKSVDYYFVTWYSSNLDIDKITNSFQGQSLKKFVSVVPGQYTNNSQGPSYLSSHVLTDIMSTDYDIIIDTRPDILSFMTYEFEPDIPNNTVLTRWTNKHSDLHNRIQSDDIFQIMKKDIFKIFCNTYKKSVFFKEPHVNLHDQWVTNRVNVIAMLINEGNEYRPRFIKSKIAGWGDSLIVRPNNLKYIINNPNISRSEFGSYSRGDKWGTMWRLTKDWKRLDPLEKTSFCLEYNISINDYL